MTYRLRILGLLCADEKGKQLWEIKLGFHPLEPNYQVLRNALVYLQKKGFITVDKRLGHGHYNYKVTSEGRKYFEKHYIPLKLIEQNRIKPSIQGGTLHE